VRDDLWQTAFIAGSGRQMREIELIVISMIFESPDSYASLRSKPVAGPQQTMWARMVDRLWPNLHQGSL